MSERRYPLKKADMSNIVPDIAEGVEYKGNKYRVTGWLKDYVPKPLIKKDDNMPDEIFQIFVDLRKKRNKEKRYEWCLREEAQYVTIYAVCGHVAKINEVKRAGYYIDWPEEFIQDAKNRQEKLIGEITP